MPLEINIQLSLFGKMSWERFLLATGWIWSRAIRVHRFRGFNACCWKMGKRRNGARGMS